MLISARTAAHPLLCNRIRQGCDLAASRPIGYLEIRRGHFASSSSAMRQSESLPARDKGLHNASKTLLQGMKAEHSPLVSAALYRILQLYAEKTPSALQVIDGIVMKKFPSCQVYHDHFAFRTFGVAGLGIQSLATVLQALGYKQQQDCFTFPKKKLIATWFAPTDRIGSSHLPRIFVSELQVEKLSQRSQDIISRYTSCMSCNRGLSPVHTMCALMTAALPWQAPQLAHYEALLQDSEYAAWVLAHGYALNHSTLAIHRLNGFSGDIHSFSQLVQQAGFKLNEEGGIVKISPDGLLLQSSTLADTVCYSFADGTSKNIAGSYIEFAERRVLPQFTHLQAHQVQEQHRRDGFEVGNADKIFQSTSVAAKS